ncbi:MAG: hypothetical protein AB9917_04995 [Negativicutes bacterium]
MALSLLVFLFLGGMLVAVSPMIINEVKMNTVNRDMVDAQFAAEAGAKTGIAAIYAQNADWTWLGTPNNLTTTDTNKTYNVSIVNASTNAAISGAPVSGTTYKISSTGTVNGVSKKAVASVLFSSSGGGIFSYSMFSNGKIDVNGTVNMTGNIASNTSIDLHWSNGTIDGYAYAPEKNVIDHNKISKGSQAMSNLGTIDIAGLMPAMPAFSMTGIDLKTTWTSGQWGGKTYSLTSPFYYYNGNYDLNGHYYTVPAGKSVSIYVNGKFNIMSAYSIKGGNITVYAKDGIQFTGGAIEAGSGGTVSLYTPKSVEVNSNSYINGSTVTILAPKSVTLNGGDINQSLSGAVTKIYTKDFTLNSSSSAISGAGVGMVVATNNINITSGSAPTTIMMAGNDISAKASTSTVVGGLYANDTINITGLKVNFDSLVSTQLGLSAGSGGADVSNLIWARQ